MSLRLIHVDQCRLGAASMKPTMLRSTSARAIEMQLKCNRRTHACPLTGFADDGAFRTAAGARYPSACSRAMAEVAIDDILRTGGRLQPRPQYGGTAPWESDLRPSLWAAWRRAQSMSGRSGRLQL